MNRVESAPDHDPAAIADRFRADGCADLGRVLAEAEVARWTDAFARDRADEATAWRMHQNADNTVNADCLVTTPAFDALVRHPRLLAAAAAALGCPARFWEVSLRWIAPLGGRTHADQWHQDFAPGPCVRIVQAMVLLTAVDAGTPCLAVVPRGAGDAATTWVDEDRRRPHVECRGPAGTAWIFDPTCWHTARFRGDAERRTVQVYYRGDATAMDPPCSPHGAVPRRLWDGRDPEAAAFYRWAPHGRRTAAMSAAFA